jgi:hypothetical protein
MNRISCWLLVLEKAVVKKSIVVFKNQEPLVFCQVKFLKKIIKNPHFHQGKLLSFSGTSEDRFPVCLLTHQGMLHTVTSATKQQ